ncbi:MAG: hypothetical protein K8R35_07590, partial [Bacteroidales bacterium]|nr:hypothetical protein [Bacteroidales bacterium]
MKKLAAILLSLLFSGITILSLAQKKSLTGNKSFTNMAQTIKYFIALVITGLCSSCNQNINQYQMGSYGYDKEFFRQNNIDFLELKTEDGLSRLLII